MCIQTNTQYTLLTYLKEQFTEQDQQLFLDSFYLYLQYDSEKDFVINLDDIYQWIGFANKGNAKRTLENNFTKGEDYKNLLLRTEKQVKDGKNLGGAGLNEESLMLNVDTFKNLCILAKTDKGKEIRKYYVKMEKCLHSYLKLQLETQLETHN
jgi:phage anti-repressor protein